MSEIEAGTIVAGKYRVDGVIGIGGMGFVVAATHLQLEQKLALKFLRKESLENAEVVQRFLRESRAAVRLRGEHVARVYDVGVHDDGRPFMVMEYLEGDDLSALLKARGPIPVEETVDYILQACEALAEAHGLGIVHRDLKPANLFLTHTPAGTPLVKVLDFGISKANPLGDSGTAQPSITSSASMLGSPGYMAPEQMRSSRDVDVRSDIWSIGIILFRLISGKVPFRGETLGDILHKVMSEPTPSLRALCPHLPPGFEYVVEKCLRKDRVDRFANLAELASALAPYAAESMRSSAGRVAMVLSGAGSRPSLPSGTASSVQVVSVPTDSTNGTGTTKAAWTGEGSTKRRMTRVSFSIAAGAVMAALLSAGLLLGAFLMRSRVPRPVMATETALQAPRAEAPVVNENAVNKAAVSQAAVNPTALAPVVPTLPGPASPAENASPALRDAGIPPPAAASARGRPTKSRPSGSASSSVVASDIPSTRE